MIIDCSTSIEIHENTLVSAHDCEVTEPISINSIDLRGDQKLRGVVGPGTSQKAVPMTLAEETHQCI